jgi:hypothetical protein
MKETFDEKMEMREIAEGLVGRRRETGGVFRERQVGFVNNLFERCWN